MRTDTHQAPQGEGKGRTIILTVIMAVITAIMFSHGKIPQDPKEAIALIVTFLFANTLFFLLIYTGKTDRYRAVYFSTFAVALIISFISHMFEARGSMSLSEAKVLQCEVPFCHLVIPMTLVPMALTKTIIFPGSLIGGYASIASMFVLWIGATLALGRGFCSWGCFYGGLDDGFSRVLKRPVIKKINPKWIYLPFAVLLFVVLTAAAYLSPTYCTWFCPFKAVTEFEAVTSTKILIQTIIFVSLFIGLVIVLPILTKRRTQCAFLCPFGAMQSLTNKINVFDVRIDKEKCVKCKRCIQVCPTLSMSEESLEQGRPRITCMKCGKCIDNCPKGAISYHVKGTDVAGNNRAYRLLFLFAAFLFISIFSSHIIQDGIIRVLKLITTGSMIP
ncbi:MAG TPA: 4Fe-4S binding protein [Syntrophorhabdaceae bacterium]|nr:4Fe-4S binding protein [Syntrophorhabdaceae bacterium]HNT69013.1 4Fe-4S binding protein [Syntrophorhabdaceae bacterium]